MKEKQEERRRRNISSAICIVTTKEGSEFVPYELEVRLSHAEDPSSCTMVSTDEESSISDTSSSSTGCDFSSKASQEQQQAQASCCQQVTDDSDHQPLHLNESNGRFLIPDTKVDEDWVSYIFLDKSGHQDACLHNFICDLEESLLGKKAKVLS